jgi:hypothetical protein
MNGMLMSAYLLSVILTIATSFAIVCLYKEKLKSMMNSGENETEISESIGKTKKQSFELCLINPKETKYEKFGKKHKQISFLIYLFSYLVFVFIYSVFSLKFNNNALSFYRILFNLLVLSPPFFLLYTLFYTRKGANIFNIIGKLLAINFLILALWQQLFSISNNTGILDTIFLFLSFNLLPICSLLLFNIRKIRGVSLTIAVLFFSFFLLIGLVAEILISDDKLFRFLFFTLTKIPILNIFPKVSFIAFVLVIAGGIAFSLINLLKYFYQKGIFSVLQLQIDSYILIYSMYVSSIEASIGNKAYLLLLVSFLIYKTTQIVLFKYMDKKSLIGRKMLFLRVFDLNLKGEMFFNSLEKYWRFIGPVQLISGPDLIYSTVEPHEVVAYLGGSLQHQFCKNETQVVQNIAQIKSGHNFDLSYQTNELYCDKGNWKLVLQKLVLLNDVIIMDLRSFNDSNKGCIYEITQLCTIANFQDVFFIVDDTTDMELFSNTITSTMSKLDQTSPNNSNDTCKINYYNLNIVDAHSIEELMGVIETKIRYS